MDCTYIFVFVFHFVICIIFFFLFFSVLLCFSFITHLSVYLCSVRHLLSYCMLACLRSKYVFCPFLRFVVKQGNKMLVTYEIIREKTDIRYTVFMLPERWGGRKGEERKRRGGRESWEVD